MICYDILWYVMIYYDILGSGFRSSWRSTSRSAVDGFAFGVRLRGKFRDSELRISMQGFWLRFFCRGGSLLMLEPFIIIAA